MDCLRSPRGKLLVAAALLSLLGGMALLREASPTSVARALAASLAAALLGWWWWRARTAAAGPRLQTPPRLQVHARTGLSPRCGLALVEADGRTFLVAYGDGFAHFRATASSGRTPARRRAVRTGLQAGGGL